MSNLKDDLKLARRIAKRVNEKGGRAYYVGGYVRDLLLGIENKDIDIEVYGLNNNELEMILNEFGNVIYKGKSFGIYGLAKTNLDIALPRKEVKTGNRHQDFKIEIDPYIKPEIACLRRDFTINALMMDVLNEKIYDYVSGLNDLREGIIRHIKDENFIEDPLRVLRAAQFASRFNFNIDDKTKELCKSINITSLSKERVEEETKKALLKSKRPSQYFEYLREMEQLDVFYKTLKDLIGTKQNPIYHPEGDVWNHTMLAIDKASEYKDLFKEPYKFMNLALYHDIGKPYTTKICDKGYLQSINHEIVGSDMVNQISYIKDKSVIKYLKNGILYHMELNKLYANSKNINKYCKLLNKLLSPLDMIYFSLVDKKAQANRYSNEEIEKELKYLKEIYYIYQERLKLPVVTGEDLIKAGLKPDANFKEILKKAEDLRMCNISKDSALKQLLNNKNIKK